MLDNMRRLAGNQLAHFRQNCHPAATGSARLERRLQHAEVGQLARLGQQAQLRFQEPRRRRATLVPI